MKNKSKKQVQNVDKSDEKLLLSDVSKSYVIALKTVNNIVEGKKYELIETIYMGAYIIDESCEKQYYKYGDFNFC